MAARWPSWLDTPATPSLTTIVAARRSGPPTRPPTDTATTDADERPGPHVDRCRRRGAELAVGRAVRRGADAFARGGAHARRGRPAVIPMLAGLDSPTMHCRRRPARRLRPAPRSPCVAADGHRGAPPGRGISGRGGCTARTARRGGRATDRRGRCRRAWDRSAISRSTSTEIAELVESEHVDRRSRSRTTIALDPLSALVLAGRQGVSRKRLARLPLARSIDHSSTRLVPIARHTARCPLGDRSSRRSPTSERLA